ncbi:MAG: type IV pili methyl-accepting chemotaxis transducer N-terminal domain-containing protein, partial [Burkholderiaceae bacterium]|nr:type IV pili methyl-accepting chemotaxis transducer N-terminal domain-containing protein [Burkholderiaceae bacterium]
QPRTNRHEDLAPDTAILEDLLPDDDFVESRPAPARASPSSPGAGTSAPHDARPVAPAHADFAAPPMAAPVPKAPVTVSDRSDAPAAPARPRDRFQIPVIGAMPFRKQLEVWLPLLFVAVLISFLFLWVDSRQASDATRWLQQIGDALTHSQRVAKAAPQAIAGDPDAFMQLRESRDIVNRSITQLAEGGDTGRGVPSEMLSDIQKLQQAWSASSDAAQVIGYQSALLQSLGAMRREVIRVNPQMLEAAQAVAASKLQAGASNREVAAAGELVMLTQRIAKDVNELVFSGMSDNTTEASLRQSVTSFRDLTDSLLSGNDRMRIPAAADPEARRALGELKKMMAGIDQSLAGILSSLPRLQQAKQAERKIFGDSETVRAQLEGVRGKLQVNESGRVWNLAIAAMFGVVALVSVYGLFRAFLSDSEHRAEDAERQQAVAQRLEQDAKRTNDQNQAAILRLMNELQEVADGDLTVQATVSEDITGAIADSVNYTVEELRNLVARINTTAELVNEASSKAQMTASSLQAASEQQSREIRETGEAVLRMAHQINDVSARAAESVKVAHQSLGASEEGSRAVNNAISGMNGIRDQIQDTAKRIKRLGESSQEIGEIVELISDITEQTNVLALNAAIQAASAGEAGRGFTIVAEEVQRLAERSAEATKQISALIRTIQTDTADAVAAMERSTQGVVEGTRLSDEAGRALGEIGRVSTTLAELIDDFSSTTSRQAASAGTVAQSIQRILLVTEQTSEGTLQTAGSI